jgi:hypothetical protein
MGDDHRRSGATPPDRATDARQGQGCGPRSRAVRSPCRSPTAVSARRMSRRAALSREASRWGRFSTIDPCGSMRVSRGSAWTRPAMPPVLAGTAIVLASGCIEARDTRATARTRSGGDGWERGGTPDRADQPPPRAPQRPAPPDRGTVRGARHETDAADAHDRGAAMKTHQAREPNERKATRRRPPEKCPVRRAKTAGPAALSAFIHA